MIRGAAARPLCHRQAPRDMAGGRIFGWGTFAVAGAILIVVLAGAYGGAEYYTAQSSFCGTVCHIMDEPNESWKNSKHYAPDGNRERQAGCVDCHFLPGEHASFKAKMEGLRHLAAYLYDPDAPMPIRPVVKDGACLQSGCHSVEKFKNETVKFGETSFFKHGAHFDKETLEGQKLFCDTCHVKHSAKKHFEVPKEICFACHFWPDIPQPDERTAGTPKLVEASFDHGAGVTFNKGASACALCHTVPTKSLQQQLSTDDASKNPITHQTLEKAGVPCESCHLDASKNLADLSLI